jgi:hypothetical protein
MFVMGILIFKGITARRVYKSFGVKGLILTSQVSFTLQIEKDSAD